MGGNVGDPNRLGEAVFLATAETHAFGQWIPAFAGMTGGGGESG
jgi:hypothetical protein